MRVIPYVQTSVFVDENYLFGGNQLATFWDAISNKGITSEEMQGIAIEMGFSESTFIGSPTMRGCSSKVRIFTPGRELPFAGHPTLGTAFVLKHREIVKKSELKTILELGIGPITVEYLSEDEIRMTQPSPSFIGNVKDKERIAEVIGVEPDEISDAAPIQIVTTGVPFIIVPMRDIKAVQKAIPYPELITTNLKDLATQEIIIFSTDTLNKQNDVHARTFAPSAGVLEDAATGSAAGPLAAYIERYNLLKGHEFGDPIKIEQGFEIKRPSKLIAEIPHESMSEILVTGKVRLMAEGNFYLK
ncbi:PhzF family phenazine biosynthesis protein [Candidatus Thorarchaeota archaeon]|nr:MAG: PhzF family phenazine biosynthesis protein [Candidatus Thorarchaeota archaeon]